MALTVLACEKAQPGTSNRKLSDGGGLFLMVRPGGTKLWQVSYRHEGKQGTRTLGRFPDVSLAEARRQRDLFKKYLAAGGDPHAEALSSSESDSFEAVAREWFGQQTDALSPGYAARVMSRIEDDLFPALGHKPVGAIEPPDVLKAIRAIEDRGAIEMAKRVRQYASAVFTYAIATGRATRDPSADIVRALKKRPRVEHRAALTAKELPEFFERLRNYSGKRQTALLIELVVHTFVRTQELRLATWSEIDGDLWRLPPEHMKMKLPHIVPLTPQTKAILRELRELTPGDRIAPVSQNTLIYGMYRLGYHSRATIHGFRRTASTILNESGLWQPDAIERQLAHVERNQVRGAYNAALYMDERVRMMHWWSEYLERQKGKVEDPLDSLLG